MRERERERWREGERERERETCFKTSKSVHLYANIPPHYTVLLYTIPKGLSQVEGDIIVDTAIAQ